MDLNFARLTFLPSGDEAPIAGMFDAQRAARLIRQAGGSNLMPAPQAMVRDAGFGRILMEYVLPVAQAVGPIIGAGLSAWFQGRAGRKLRLKVGDLEVEARTPEEIEQLLELAQALEARREAPKNEA